MVPSRVILVLIGTVLGGVLAQGENEVYYPVKVSVYYSVMCENCRAFFTAKFAPVYDDLKQWIDYDLIPFGNSTFQSGSGTITFDCPEGPDECLANKWHACANALYRGEKTHELAHFINCTLWRDDRFFDDIKKCAEANYLEFQRIQNCVHSQEGVLHLAASASRTIDHNPKLTSYPTIEFNSTFNQELQDVAVLDFKKALCMQIKDPVTGSMPEACESSAAQALPLFAVFIAALIAQKLAS